LWGCVAFGQGIRAEMTIRTQGDQLPETNRHCPTATDMQIDAHHMPALKPANM
jgi:hypothetical protein